MMKLYLLRPIAGLKDGDNPWQPWYDKSFGFVVRAGDEKEAREIAHNNAGDENRGKFLSKITSKTNEPWLNNKYSTCLELTENGAAELIIQDVASA